MEAKLRRAEAKSAFLQVLTGTPEAGSLQLLPASFQYYQVSGVYIKGAGKPVGFYSLYLTEAPCCMQDLIEPQERARGSNIIKRGLMFGGVCWLTGGNESQMS